MHAELTRDDIIEQLHELNLPVSEYAVVGSAVMAVYGIRRAGDIDMVVTEEVYEQLKADGWIEKLRPQSLGRGKSVYLENFDAGPSWSVGTFTPDPSYLIRGAAVIEGIPFVQLSEVLAWKREGGRPKDIEDVKLIEAYLRPSTS